MDPSHDDVVRRLLAEARHDEPMPSEVAERLDRVLAQLGETSGASEEPAPDELAARRRRRAASVLLAAAAVVVAGVGFGQLDRTSSEDLASGSRAEDSMDSTTNDQEAPSAQGGGTAEGSGDSGAAATAPEVASAPAPATAKTGRAFALDSDRFGVQVERLRRTALTASADASTLSSFAYRSAVRRGFACPPAPYGEGQLLAVRYDRAPAVLAYRLPAGETQVAELLQCGTAVILRSVTLPLP